MFYGVCIPILGSRPSVRPYIVSNKLCYKYILPTWCGRFQCVCQCEHSAKFGSIQTIVFILASLLRFKVHSYYAPCYDANLSVNFKSLCFSKEFLIVFCQNEQKNRLNPCACFLSLLKSSLMSQQSVPMLHNVCKSFQCQCLILKKSS